MAYGKESTMMIRLLGAVLIVLGYTAFGIVTAMNFRREEKTLKQLLRSLEFMECELQYRLSSLPELCATAAESADGIVGSIFLKFSEELKTQRYSDPGTCMDKLLADFPSAPTGTKKLLRQFGKSIGKFDLDGQLKGLQYVKSQCEDMLARFAKDADIRIRNYQTLGLCAGVALAILLI